MKRLLLAIAGLAVWPSAAVPQDCDIPSSYANPVLVDEGTLRIRYATDKTVYAPTETIHFYLVVQNLGEAPFYINWGVDPQDGHYILRPPYVTLDECCATDEDRWANTLWYLPDFWYFFSQGTTLQPGECRVWQRTIDLNWTENPVPGTYRVLGGMFNAGVYEFVVPQDGVALDIAIAIPVSTEPTTWGRVKALYR